jgi:hypothetical protein
MSDVGVEVCYVALACTDTGQYHLGRQSSNCLVGSIVGL